MQARQTQGMNESLGRFRRSKTRETPHRSLRPSVSAGERAAADWIASQKTQKRPTLHTVCGSQCRVRHVLPDGTGPRYKTTEAMGSLQSVLMSYVRKGEGRLGRRQLSYRNVQMRRQGHACTRQKQTYRWKPASPRGVSVSMVVSGPCAHFES